MPSTCSASWTTSSRCSRRCAVFVCPIRSGSGVRVKLLEAFASGIPVVSTTLGAEGLARVDGEFCALADDTAGFAAKVVQLLEDEQAARAMAARARREVEQNWDMAAITRSWFRGSGSCWMQNEPQLLSDLRRFAVQLVPGFS